MNRTCNASFYCIFYNMVVIQLQQYSSDKKTNHASRLTNHVIDPDSLRGKHVKLIKYSYTWGLCIHIQTWKQYIEDQEPFFMSVLRLQHQTIFLCPFGTVFSLSLELRMYCVHCFVYHQSFLCLATSVHVMWDKLSGSAHTLVKTVTSEQDMSDTSTAPHLSPLLGSK